MHAQSNALEAESFNPAPDETLGEVVEHILARAVPINPTPVNKDVVLYESGEERSEHLTQVLLDLQLTLDSINNLQAPISIEHYKECCAHVFGLMDKCVADALITTMYNEKRKKNDYKEIPKYEEEGKQIIATFQAVLKRLREIKEPTPKSEKKQVDKSSLTNVTEAKTTETPKPVAETKKPDIKPKTDRKPDARPSNKPSSPLAVELDGKTYNTPQEALTYSNRLNGEAEGFRQRYFGLLAQTVEKIDQSIDEALTTISKTDRIATKDNKIGVIDILKPFVEKGIVKRQGSYKPNPDIEKAKELADAANNKMNAISEKLERDRKASEERRARREAYDEVLKNGFWQTFTDEKGKEVVRFAYQIEVSRIPGTTIQQITVKKVAPLFGNVKLQEGSVFTVGGEKTPVFLNKAARELLDSQQPKAKISDVMPEKLGGRKEAK